MLRAEGQDAKVRLRYAKLGRAYRCADLIAFGVVLDSAIVGRGCPSEYVIGFHEIHQRIYTALKEPVTLSMLRL
ncbi:hypothetical protein ACFYY2_32125 [Streptomyces sp. NPDC001822]|uniref:hypothetical protein n=1 Tax=Streptomyces sp. NPDC001822 TaxID=3364614 RepID=UPI0036BBF41A